MGLLQKLQSLFGFGSTESGSVDGRDVSVTVERERGGDTADVEEPGEKDTDIGDAVEADSGVVDDSSEDDEEDMNTAETESAESESGDESGGDPVAAETTASSSTAELTDVPTEPDEAAEPAEATGPDAEDAVPEAEDAVPEAEDTAAPSETEDTAAPSETEDTGEPVDVIKGIGPAYADRLEGAGVETVADLAAADAESLGEETDISPKRLQGWIDRAAVR